HAFDYRCRHYLGNRRARQQQGLHRGKHRGCRIRRRTGVPDGHAARCRGRRRPAFGSQPHRCVHRCVDRRRNPWPRAGARLICRGLGNRRIRVIGRTRGHPAGLGAIGDHARVLVGPGGTHCHQCADIARIPPRSGVEEGVAMTSDHIAERLRQLQAQDLPTHGGRTLAYVYDSGLGDVDEVGRQALVMFASSNGLDPTVFPSLLQMERDLVAFARSLVDGPDEAVGTVTSGGTESILLAVQAARDAAPHVQKAAMIVPSTIHAAFAKAAHYFGVEQIKVDVDPVTFKAVPDAMEAALMQHRERVVLMAASAPSYAHGVIDPIARLAAVAAHTQIRFHVDACIGGWVLPWAERAGLVPDPWDFRVAGVTSISVDLHKYAYTPKGASLLLHRSPELRRSHEAPSGA